MPSQKRNFPGKFNDAMTKLSACFPAVAEWVRGLDNSQAVLAQWEHELSDFTRQELLDAIELIRAGHADRPEAYERDYWPLFIQRAAEKVRVQAQAKADYGRFTHYRVKCQLCRDIGSVEIWSVATMEIARKRFLGLTDDPMLFRTEFIQCLCESGRGELPYRSGKKGGYVMKPVPRYRPDLYTLASDGEDSLLTWASSYQPKRPNG